MLSSPPQKHFAVALGLLAAAFSHGAGLLLSPGLSMTDHLQQQFTEPIKREKADALYRLGFRLIRLPVPNLENDFVIVGSVNNLLAAGFNVVLDLHPQVTRDLQKSDDFWIQPALWRNIAKQFKGQALDRLAFEILNEPDFRRKNPRPYESWMNLCIDAIRDVDPRRWIVASTPYMGDVDHFDGPEASWTAPKVDRLIVPMHYYRPMAITHPQSYVSRGAKSQNLKYPPEPDGDDFNSKDAKNMSLHFQKYGEWCRKNGVTPWIGEAGCHEDTPGRQRWFQDVKAVADRAAIPVCWWSTDGFGIQARWQGTRYNIVHPDILAIITGRRR